MSSGSGKEVRGGQAGRPAEQRLLIDSIIRRAAEATPEAPAACVGTRENGYSTLSYAELERDANRIAAVLRDRLGISLGDRVLGWADTSIEVLPLFVALAKIGAVFAPLNARLGSAEAAEIAQLAQAKLLIVDSPRAADAPRVAASAGISEWALLPVDAEGLSLIHI